MTISTQTDVRGMSLPNWIRRIALARCGFKTPGPAGCPRDVGRDRWRGQLWKSVAPCILRQGLSSVKSAEAVISSMIERL